VVAEDGTWLAAPNLIYRYVRDHRYAPPATFVEAEWADREQRAALVAAHREAVGWDDPDRPLGRMPGDPPQPRQRTHREPRRLASIPPATVPIRRHPDGKHHP
jgi:hypothetical protein